MIVPPQGSDLVRVALVGCGAIGELVAQHVYATATRGFRLVAAIDPQAERREAVAGPLGVPSYPSAQAAVDAGVVIEAADIRTPHARHADTALDALGRGWHVLVEKPLATTLADGERIQRAAAAAGRVAAVAENYPHIKAVQAARDAMAAGTVGEVLALRTTRAFTLGGVWLRDGWRRGGGPSGGLLLDQGTHHTSLLRYLGGPISQVSAVASDAGADTLLLTVRFASGLVAQSLYSWTAFSLAAEAEGTVFGSRGRIEIRVDYDTDQGGAALWDEQAPGGRAISRAENYYDSHRSIVEDWASAIRAGGRPLVSVDDGLADLAVVLAAARSLDAGGRPIDVTD
ncbi:MAG TPA: Gfo/Idh/MocA family oxidoreductase [Streptosporangiaceae bacterium]|jgi:predicted dehydrogenase|nr:Gfo/Idh/MocA family oxidoreductase [Streptosporangiaceae bacterium]